MSMNIGRLAGGLVFAAGAVMTLLVEIEILSRIFAHPAARQPMRLPITYIFAAVLPVLLQFVAYMLKRHTRATVRDMRAFLWSWSIGICGSLVGLSQYSHSSPGILFLAYVGQWFVAVRYYSLKYSSGPEA